MSLRFVTTNPGKVREAREYLDTPVSQLEFDTPEIQDDDLGAVAAHKARAAYRHAGEPVIVDDSGMFVAALDGFPGPYSSYVYDTLGIDRVWRLAKEEDDRSAAFRAVVAYCDGGEFAATPEPVDRDERRGQDQDSEERATATTDEQVRGDATADDGAADALPVKLFEGVVPGEIVAPRGDGGFGYDPVFEHDGRTFAEMDPDEKNAISHRGRALAKFAEWHAAADR
jgi:XTP/dITP diphosphohydrolase